MKRTLLVILCLLCIPSISLAAIPEMYTNDNIFTSEHDKPVSLFLDNLGGFYGYTETGMFYTQKPISNVFKIRLHKFSIGEAYFYVSDRGIISAPGDLTALSIYFARV